jgi:hypothetical protein
MKDKDRDEAVASWRQENWKAIMDANRAVLESIRADPDASNKDKIEAAKLLARMADIVSPEKIITKGKAEEKAEAAIGLTEADVKLIHDLTTGKTVDSISPTVM